MAIRDLWDCTKAKNKKYFDDSEVAVDEQWRNIIVPFLQGIDIKGKKALDLAAGTGRHCDHLNALFDKVDACDINLNNIETCRQKRKYDNAFLTNGNSILAENEYYDFVFSFDSMVHFDINTILDYLHEIKRVLKPGGYAFLHISNLLDSQYTAEIYGDITKNPHWRNLMCHRIFATLINNVANLDIVKFTRINWAEYANLDNLYLLRKII